MVAYLKILNILELLVPCCCCPMIVAAQELMEQTAEDLHVQEWVSKPYILLGPGKGWVPWMIHHQAELKVHYCNFTIWPQTKRQTEPKAASPSFSSLSSDVPPEKHRPSGVQWLLQEQSYDEHCFYKKASCPVVAWMRGIEGSAT